MSDRPAARPSPGRPTQIDRAELARVAIELFKSRGYDAVSMEDVATAAGVGRRSLFRYFPSKADLVWDGVDPVSAELRRQLEAAASDIPLIDAYIDAFIRALSTDAIDLELSRTRLRIIGSHPELFAQASMRLVDNSTVLTAFVEGRRKDLAGTAGIPALADVLGTITYSALVYWATHTEDDRPDACLRDAGRALAGLGTEPGELPNSPS